MLFYQYNASRGRKSNAPSSTQPVETGSHFNLYLIDISRRTGLERRMRNNRRGFIVKPKTPRA